MQIQPISTMSNTTYQYLVKALILLQKLLKAVWEDFYGVFFISTILFCSVSLTIVTVMSFEQDQRRPIVYSGQEFYTEGFPVTPNNLIRQSIWNKKACSTLLSPSVHILPPSFHVWPTRLYRAYILQSLRQQAPIRLVSGTKPLPKYRVMNYKHSFPSYTQSE